MMKSFGWLKNLRRRYFFKLVDDVVKVIGCYCLLLKVDKRKTFQFCSLRILVVLMESLQPTVHCQT